ncbi:unnamed protein product [Rotaria magnacalcarata]|uniref:Arrestin-like N-terminal domain-containing protein n=1 Tax=Rotaria magnacalcarata TaxID=392030 RepID=A0A815D4A0_9BILA|nr:unnamed protein product [Rotaria magnacalcarata]CAF3913064.1 unnamed protein product [Rotaria magnacalcarata]CAF4689742.1 unnamed protein product [Rotaria magnacalcarata]
MGAHESALIQMNFNRSTESYFPGEHVSGEIVFQNKHDRLKVEEIFIEIVGELAYKTTESRSSTDLNGNSSTEYYNDYHHIPFFTNRLPLARPDGLQDKIILSSGTHTWPFDFSLPENLPPSSSPNVDAYPHIKYHTQIVLDRPRFKMNVKRTYPLSISRRLNEFNELYFQRDFDLPVPSINLTPTHTFSTLHYGYSYNFNVNYELLLKVKSHGIFTNFEVSIPVVVVAEAILEGQQQNKGFGETDAPPSYEASYR